ncbi:hypothetical protein [Pseudochryseolinea flava]|uniref:hypothetical protein n=1 Tax=Pseudochryseolinea flava TaxID=2059302 RepID=UPI00105805C9|nr:hypothetical protein [Pseudochryseolinea flava]
MDDLFGARRFSFVEVEQFMRESPDVIVYINFHEPIVIFKDVVRAQSMKEALLFLFGDAEVIGNYKKKHAQGAEMLLGTDLKNGLRRFD